MADLLCTCNGCPVKGAVCGYVTVGGEHCTAPDDYDCDYKKVKSKVSTNRKDKFIDDCCEDWTNCCCS